MTPNQFSRLLQRQGFTAQLSVAGGRIAQILSGSEGVEYTITFLPRSESGSSVDDFVAFTFLFLSQAPNSDGPEYANILNMRSRFIRYSVNGDAMSAEMDVAIPSEELTDELAMRQVNIWIIGLARFIEAISE